MDLIETPGQLGFRMPAEWEPHERTWMAWPCRLEAWGAAERMARARVAYARVAAAIAAYEPLTMVARAEDADEAQKACGSRVEVMALPIDDSWMRDFGPTFVARGVGSAREIAGTDWQFNAWGHEYEGFDHDDAVPRQVLARLKVPRAAAPIVLEGGAINSDGEGTLLTTEECVLNPNRNANFTHAKAEAMFARYLGIKRTIWLPFGFDDDETDGHVDNVAAFAGAGRILLHVASDSGDPMTARSNANLAALENAIDASGRKIEVVQVAAPKRGQSWNGRRSPASYLNFYVANRAVFVPEFGDPLDKTAQRIIGECFAGREVVALRASDIIAGGGGIHCITQQQPAGIPARVEK